MKINIPLYISFWPEISTKSRPMNPVTNKDSNSHQMCTRLTTQPIKKLMPGYSTLLIETLFFSKATNDQLLAAPPSENFLHYAISLLQLPVRPIGNIVTSMQAGYLPIFIITSAQKKFPRIYHRSIMTSILTPNLLVGSIKPHQGLHPQEIMMSLTCSY